MTRNGRRRQHGCSRSSPLRLRSCCKSICQRLSNASLHSAAASSLSRGSPCSITCTYTRPQLRGRRERRSRGGFSHSLRHLSFRLTSLLPSFPSCCRGALAASEMQPLDHCTQATVVRSGRHCLIRLSSGGHESRSRQRQVIRATGHVVPLSLRVSLVCHLVSS